MKDREQEDKVAAEALQPILAQSALLWKACLAQGDVETAYAVISADAEKYIMKRATGSALVPAPLRGRGELREQKVTTMPQWGACEETGAGTHRFHQIQSLLRRAEELVRKCSLRGMAALQEQDSYQIWQRMTVDATGLSLRRTLCP